MRWWLGLALTALTLAAPVASFGADAVSLAGKWNVLITHSSGGCAWLGQVTLTQTASALEGEGWAAAEQTSTQNCAPLLEGNVAGVIEGRVVQLGFGTGALGIANFRGLILKGDGDMTGWWNADNAGGDWTASRAAQ